MNLTGLYFLRKHAGVVSNRPLEDYNVLLIFQRKSLMRHSKLIFQLWLSGPGHKYGDAPSWSKLSFRKAQKAKISRIFERRATKPGRNASTIECHDFYARDHKVIRMLNSTKMKLKSTNIL